ncbi:MAG: alanine--tRNA ligase [Nitrospirae bacterium]|nr:alanine--tRNA ligase [Nitrospirota bacterium]
MSLSSRELRHRFVAFFEAHGHRHAASAPLVPKDDPSLLFTNAGMVPFKTVFTGEEPRKWPTAASVQKCMRAGGKHNDLENVGHTGRHHTFFEMLGNFSFGDYFKEEAIRLAWEFLTREIGLPRERLWVSVYQDDDEAFGIWRDQEHVPEHRILRLGEKDNFWRMGDTGPCGPCTEIHIDQGADVGCGRPTCQVGCDDDTCDRFLEVWNLVFMQYERSANGTLTPLPRPSIDTGMGLERLTAVVNGVTNNYDTDLFQPIIHAAATQADVAYGDSREGDTALRVLADHARAITFLLADGVLPANDGRGYVLRRIIRRAARYGRTIGMRGHFLAGLTGEVVALMGDVYPELVRARDTIFRITQGEEERFAHTLDQGLDKLTALLDQVAASGGKALPGKDLFNLYDTYGFPVDLAADIARERGLAVDLPGFEAAMAEQKVRARASWKGAEGEVSMVYAGIAQRVGAVPFLGYQQVAADTTVAAIVAAGKPVQAATEGTPVEVVLAQTPFYAESGGQVGDTGELIVEQGGELACTVAVTDTRRPVSGLVVHHGTVTRGTLAVGAAINARVNAVRRKDVARNHTATHLLHAVLRDVLGDHVKQAGSLVQDDRLRFDFTHFLPMSMRDLERVEEAVNENIRGDYPVATQVQGLEAAIAGGATALFGEKYEDDVRVVRIADVSAELCGGTHVGAVGEIGLLRIVSEGSVGAGVRRIEAVTGRHALASLRAREGYLAQAAQALKTAPETLADKIAQLMGQLKERDRQIDRLQRKLTEGGAADEAVTEVNGVTVLTRRDDGLDVNALRALSDRVRDKLGSGAALLATVNDGQVSLLCVVSKDLTGRVKAGDLMREAAAMVGGKGGGRPDMAQGGGDDAGALDGALSAFPKLVAARTGG